VPITLLVRAADIPLARLVGVTGRKRVEADMIAGPAWTLEGRASSAATSTACAGTQFVAWGIRAPQDDSDSASERRVMLAAFTP
jgi:hypothetical protein